jgi:hypothetical protein
MNLSLRWKKEWAPILGLVLMLRLIYALIGWSVASGPEPEPLASGPVYDSTAPLLSASPAAGILVNVWCRWDTPYYLSIAAHGYEIERTQAYLPLYPWLIKGLALLTGGDYLLSGLLVSTLASLAAGILFYEVARVEGWTAPDALQSTVALFMFPTAFFLFASYSEALFLALTLSAWLLARRLKWARAGLAGALASLTRYSGALLTPVLLWMFLVNCAEARNQKLGRQVREIWKSAWVCLTRPAWLWTLLPAAAIGIYLLAMRLSRHGAPSNVLETYWGIETVPPWEGVRLFLDRLFFRPRVFIDWIDLSLFVIVLAFCVYGLFRLDPALSMYSWLNLSLLMMRGTPPHLLDSFSRYFLVLFPVFLLFGRAGNRVTRTIGWAFSFMLQIVLTWAFMEWKWVA